MTDRELLDQIWLKLLDVEKQLVGVKQQTTHVHRFIPPDGVWAVGYAPTKVCAWCGILESEVSGQ